MEDVEFELLRSPRPHLDLEMVLVVIHSTENSTRQLKKVCLEVRLDVVVPIEPFCVPT